MMLKEKKNSRLYEMAAVFFVSTTCICLLEGIFGIIFFSEQQLDFGAYFSPPLFGLVSALLSGVVIPKDKKNVNFQGLVVRQVLLLVLIEVSVFGINYVGGNVFSVKLSILIIIAIAVIYGMVCFMLYLNDRRSADEFNQRLKRLQRLQTEVYDEKML